MTMKTLHSRPFAVAATLAATVTIASAADLAVVSATRQAPMAHTVNIPADTRLSSIRFESVKLAGIYNTDTAATDGRCEQALRGEPGGSMFCAPAEPAVKESVYKVTYSYEAEPMASDESNNKHYSFNVYFRPEELTAEDRKLAALGKSARAEIAAIFEWTTTRENQTRVVVDKANSNFCEGTYADGSFVKANPKCEEHVNYKTVAIPSDYITVKVSAARTTEITPAE
jgi:hypothetical protein